MLPPLFTERLKQIIPPERMAEVTETFSRPKAASIRINTLKAQPQEILQFMKEKNLQGHAPLWYDRALVLKDLATTEVSRWDLTSQGKIYIQSLSSMLPVVILDPQPQDHILDLCAAPGSKTTQMAAHMNNQGRIVAVEAIRERLYRLKSVANLLEARIIEPKCLDGRRFRSPELFDRVLVDAPCSSEGRFKTFDKKSIGYWNLRKIREMVKKQRGLLWNACRLLKPGGVAVYSTCTFAPEENEGVVSWVLRKMEGQVSVEPLDLPGLERYPSILQWQDHSFNAQVKDCLRVLPSGEMDGFFVTKFIKR